MGMEKRYPEETKVESETPELDGIRATPKEKKSREPGVADLEKNGVYDREAILDHLADFANIENEGQFIYDIARLNTGSAEPLTETEFSKIFANKESTAEDRHKLLVERLRKTLKDVPDLTLHMMTGWVRPVRPGRLADQKPDWLDMDKIRRGQKFAQDYMFAVLYATVLGLISNFVFGDTMKTFIFTGKTIQPFPAFKRYLSTVLRLRRWYTQDYLTKGTRAWRDILAVRAMHSVTSKKLQASTNEEIDAATKIPNAYCPAREIMIEDFVEACGTPATGQCPFSAGQNSPNRPKGIRQTEMSATQWNVVSALISNPQRFGIHHATDEDLEAYCHWVRSIGYQLGIEDEYNFCRGTLEDIRKRCSDLLDTWIKPHLREITPEWEHMSRSLVTIPSTLPGITFEMMALHWLEALDIPMPRLYASLSYMDRIIYYIFTGFLYYGMKIPGVTWLVNAGVNLLLNRFEKYTPDQFEALRIKLSAQIGNHSETTKHSAT